MKKFIMLFLLLVAYKINAQEILPFGSTINFEDTVYIKYINIDNDSIWYIGEPHKEYLFIPDNILFLGDNVIYTDTNQYYGNNIHASFQFKLELSGTSICTIDFYQVFDFEPNKDGGIVETSWDNGIIWENIIFDSRIMDNIWNDYFNLYGAEDTIAVLNYQPGFTGLFPEGRDFQVGWYEYGEIDTLILRFTFASDSNDAQNEGWLLDNFDFRYTVEDQVPERRPLEEVTIYPNPTESEFHLFTQYSTIKRIEVLSIMGNVLIMEEDSDLKTIDVSFLKTGLYIVRCMNDSNQQTTLKLFKL